MGPFTCCVLVFLLTRPPAPDPLPHRTPRYPTGEARKF